MDNSPSEQAVNPLARGHWLAIRDRDPRGLALYLRHYSSLKARGATPRRTLSGNKASFCGPGAHMLLLTDRSDALFVWRNQQFRADDQDGVECTIFRNEGPVLSSVLIAEACDLAWSRWPRRRLFTFVDASQIASPNPGYCFKVAGWRTCGRTSKRHLHILERLS